MPSDLPTRLRHARLARGMSHEAAAAWFGVSRLTYYSWERGAYAPKVDRAAKVAEFLGVTRLQALGAILRTRGDLPSRLTNNELHELGEDQRVT